MSLNVTTYLVETRYVVDDRRAKGGLGGIAKEADRAARSSDFLKRSLLGVGAAVVGGSIFGAAKKGLIDFGSSMEQARIQMAGMIQLNKGGDWTKNLRTANDLVGQLQVRARASVGTTKDFVDMASMITRPVMAAGLGMKDLENFTASAVVASKAFGIEAGMAARDIEAALMGQFHSVDRFNRALLDPMGFGGEQGREKFNAMSAQDRAATMRQALANPAITQMAQAQANTWEGVTSTFKDHLQMALQKVGLPLMKQLTAEVQNWSKWIEKNPDKIKAWAKDFGSALVTGFNALKTGIGFLVTHKDAILAIAKAVLVWKGVSAIGGLAGGFSKGAGKMSPWLEGMRSMPSMNQGLAASTSSLATFSQKVGGTIPFLTGMIGGLGALGIAVGSLAQSIADQVDEAQTRSQDAKVASQSFDRYFDWGKSGRHRTFASFAKEEGFLNAKGGVISDQALSSKLMRIKGAGWTAEHFGEFKAQLIESIVAANQMNEAEKQRAQLREGFNSLGTDAIGWLSGGAAWADTVAQVWRNGDPLGAINMAYRWRSDAMAVAQQWRKALEPLGDYWADVVREKTMAFDIGGAVEAMKSGLHDRKERMNVTIQKIEVPAKDPDRWIADLDDAIVRRVRAPRQARNARRRGM